MTKIARFSLLEVVQLTGYIHYKSAKGVSGFVEFVNWVRSAVQLQSTEFVFEGLPTKHCVLNNCELALCGKCFIV